MNKILTGLVAVALATTAGIAAADQRLHLDETYSSGATFSGDLTFTDGFQSLIAVSGVLAGGDYGTDTIGWTWNLGSQGLTAPQNDDGNATTSEDWLMDGTAPDVYSHYIGLSWSATGGNFQLVLTPATDVYYAGVDDRDAAISASVTAVPESTNVAMLLAGLGLVGTLARRRRARA